MWKVSKSSHFRVFPLQTKHVPTSQQTWLGSASSLEAAPLLKDRKISKLDQVFSYFWTEKNPPIISEQRERASWQHQRWGAAGRQPEPGPAKNGTFGVFLLSPPCRARNGPRGP